MKKTMSKTMFYEEIKDIYNTVQNLFNDGKYEEASSELLILEGYFKDELEKKKQFNALLQRVGAVSDLLLTNQEFIEFVKAKMEEVAKEAPVEPDVVDAEVLKEEVE